MLRLVPQLLLRPDCFVLLPHRIRKIPRQRQQQAHGVLRHRHGKNSAWICHHNSGIPQFRVHELRHARRGGVDPFQLLRVLQLLRAQGIAHKNVRIRQFLGQVVVVGQMHHAHVRPSLSNRLRHRRLRPPLGKRMPHTNDKFCFCRFCAAHDQTMKGCANPFRSYRRGAADPVRSALSAQCRATIHRASIAACCRRSLK